MSPPVDIALFMAKLTIKPEAQAIKKNVNNQPKPMILNALKKAKNSNFYLVFGPVFLKSK